jgi:hypothetical protein
MFSIKSVTCYFVAGILMGTAPASAQIQQPSPQAQFLARSLQQPQAQFLARYLHQDAPAHGPIDVVEPRLAVATTQIQQASPQQASPQAQVRSQQQGSQQAAPAITIITPGATAIATAGLVTRGVTTGVIGVATTSVTANPAVGVAVSPSIAAARRR